VLSQPLNDIFIKAETKAKAEKPARHGEPAAGRLDLSLRSRWHSRLVQQTPAAGRKETLSPLI